MQVYDWLSLAVVLGSGLAGGIFFTFSNFVMPALARLTASQGILAMQAINITVINPAALGIMLGTGVLAAAATVLAFVDEQQQLNGLILGAALVYIFGCVGVTMLGNVPLNDRLAKADANSSEAAEFWQHYLQRWTFWNTARTSACVMSCAGFTIAITMS